mgnify:CR=1 FL=1
MESLQWEATLARAQSAGKDLLDALLDNDAPKAKSALDKAHYPLAGPFHHASEDNFAVCMRALLFPDPRYATLSETYMGLGRADLLCLPTPEGGKGLPAIIFELKVGKSDDEALGQIEDREYASSLKGYEGNILEVGIDYDPESKTHEVKIARV